MGGARCTCGRHGCMEAYAGRAAMEIEARRQVKKGRNTELFEIMEKRGRTRLQSGIWERALEREDALAMKLIDRAVEALGAGVASVVNVLDVETVVIGGGLGSRLGEPYVERIREAMLPHLFVSDRPPGGAPRRARRPRRRDRRQPARQGSRARARPGRNRLLGTGPRPGARRGSRRCARAGSRGSPSGPFTRRRLAEEAAWCGRSPS